MRISKQGSAHDYTVAQTIRNSFFGHLRYIQPASADKDRNTDSFTERLYIFQRETMRHVNIGERIRHTVIDSEVGADNIDSVAFQQLAYLSSFFRSAANFVAAIHAGSCMVKEREAESNADNHS